MIKCLSEPEWARYMQYAERVFGVAVPGSLATGERPPTWFALVDARDLAGLWLMGEAGLRVGELCGLVQSDVFILDHVVRELLVRPAVAKGGVERLLPLSTVLRGALARLSIGLQSQGVFESRYPLMGCRKDWARLTTRRVQQVVARIGWECLERMITPHQLRHTFAVRLRRRVDLPVVQALLGHRSLSSTACYMNVSGEDLRTAVASLSAPALSGGGETVAADCGHCGRDFGNARPADRQVGHP